MYQFTHTHMPQPEARISSVTLAAWEHGPLREIVETEFEMAIIDAIGKRGLRLTPQEERILHDAVVPDACLAAIERQFITQGPGHGSVFHLRKQHELQRMIVESLEIVLDDRESAARVISDTEPPVMGHLLLAFRKMPSRLRKFLSP
jgi:hypothetical protein